MKIGTENLAARISRGLQVLLPRDHTDPLESDTCPLLKNGHFRSRNEKNSCLRDSINLSTVNHVPRCSMSVRLHQSKTRTRGYWSTWVGQMVLGGAESPGFAFASLSECHQNVNNAPFSCIGKDRAYTHADSIAL
jgi:hypothetical protein